MISIFRRRARGGEVAAEACEQVAPSKAYIPEEIIAAIGVALVQYEDDLRHAEHMVLTINRVARAYSPWSSKIYGIMNQPVRHVAHKIQPK
ncbi:MAG: hypothetical protein LBH06_04680 [Rikenellaceae bacterium]|jgi:uncharacterized membrane protein YecN with MAPEG domain|nr:hypothetical protein [Rikenellaceae bacterium]